MPLYEMVVVMRSMKRPETAACMKRVGTLLLNNGAVLRAVENLGLQRDIAYKMRAHGKSNLTGSFILYRYDGPTNLFRFLKEELQRDVDVVKTSIAPLDREKKIECTLEDELQIPMLRPSVQRLLKTGKKEEKKNPILEKIKGPF